MNWLVIVNRKADGGHAGKLWASVETSLLKNGIKFSSKFTEAPAQTRLLASNAMNMGFTGVIAFGGDGTVSDTAAAISKLDTKPVLAFLPAGSGNDWIRSAGFDPPFIDSSINAIVAGQTRLVDSGICRWPGGSRFFLNSAGIGFDALVLKRTAGSRRFLPGGKISYLLNMAVSALFPPHWRGTISCDGKPFYKGDYLTMTTGVGKYSGGGMQLSPNAVPDDGLLDCVILSPMNFFTIAKNIPKLFDGTLHKTEWATSAQGTVIRIVPEVPGSTVLELDGEVVVPCPNAPYIELVSIPQNLRIIAPPAGCI
ncbi:MAG: diacylglycerol kinase family protein [Candidatus Fermentibacteria bacterium]|nr:diacylglycerol kinase family protein [Candidatus Fermentibacteria bacterium]